MIIARTDDGLFILGITDENLSRLKLDKPIFKDLGEHGGTDKVAIIYGTTLTEIEEKLANVFGKLPKSSHLAEVK